MSDSGSYSQSQLQQPLSADPLNLNPIAGPSQTTQRFRPYNSSVHHVTKGRYITSNDPRGYIPVYEYPLNGQWIMMDVDDGYILWTGIWKALGNAKADIVKMIESQPDLAPQLRRVRGGYLKIQGTWMPYDVAVKLARRVAWPIREDLTPFFGPQFPESCLSPDQPGYGQVIPNTGGRRKARRLASLSQPRANASTSHNQPSYSGQSSSFTIPSAGLSFHPPTSNQNYQVMPQQHTMVPSSQIDYAPMTIPTHAQHDPALDLPHHGSSHLPGHDFDPTLRPSPVSLTSHDDPNINMYGFYTQQPPSSSNSYSYPAPAQHHGQAGNGQTNLMRASAPTASNMSSVYDQGAPSQSTYHLSSEDPRTPIRTDFHDSPSAYGLPPLSAGPTRSERGVHVRSHRFLPYPNVSNTASYTGGHLGSSNAVEGNYTLPSQNYQFPLPSSSNMHSINTQTGPSSMAGFDGSTESPHHTLPSPHNEATSTGRLMLPPLATHSNATSTREGEKELTSPAEELADSLAYSLPPISSLETSGQRDKGDSAAVLKRLRTDELHPRAGRVVYGSVPVEVNMGRRRSLSEPPLHGSLANSHVSAPNSSAWPPAYPESSGWSPPAQYPTAHAHYTHHRANSGGTDPINPTSQYHTGYYGRSPATSGSHPNSGSRDHSSLASPTSPGTPWSEFGRQTRMPTEKTHLADHQGLIIHGADTGDIAPPPSVSPVSPHSLQVSAKGFQVERPWSTSGVQTPRRHGTLPETDITSARISVSRGLNDEGTHPAGPQETQDNAPRPW